MDRIFYKSDLVDAYSRCPIYIFDTSFLPSPDDIDYDLFIPTLMQLLPKGRYMVILFSCGLNNINWVWGISFLKAFLSHSSSGTSNADNIHKIIAVHESWFVKSVSQIFTNFLMSKKTFGSLNSLMSSLNYSNDMLISCNSLSELSNYVDITNLKISLNVYRHDYQTTLSPNIELHCPSSNIFNSKTSFSQASDPVFYHHFYQIFNIVDIYANQVELLFHKPGKKTNTEILYNCLGRDQIIWINDWDLNCVASCFKKILTELPSPLINIRKIVLPMRDDLEYTSQVFDSLMTEEHKNAVLFQVISMCCSAVGHSSVTKHTNISISKCLSHALTHESISRQSKDSISIVVRFLKNLLHHWPEIGGRYQLRFKTVQQIVDGEELADDTINESYNMSYDLTMHTSTMSDEEEENRGTTSNILPDTGAQYKRTIKSSVNTGIKTGSARESSLQGSRTEVMPLQKLAQNKNVDHQPKENSKSPGTRQSQTSPKKHSQVSENTSIHVQFPPQKYKFERTAIETKQPLHTQPTENEHAVKKPVVRGRKVGELTKIFEERSQAMKILNTI